MNDFDFFQGTRLLFGRKKENEVGQLIKYSGGRRVLIVTGQHSSQKTGLSLKIKQSLDRAGLDFKELTGVRHNPVIDMAREGIRLCRSHNIDFVLAVGGTAVIDTVKAIAAGAFYEGDVWDIFVKKRNLYRALPIGVVLTIAGAGSECSDTAVMSVVSGSNRQKLEAQYACFQPAFAVLNPELTYSVDLKLSACSCVDIISMVCAQYFTNVSGVDLTDRLCEGLLQSIIGSLPELERDLNNYDVRADLLWAGTMAHAGFLGFGRDFDRAPQLLEYQLSALYDTPRGAGMALILPAWLTFITHHNLLRMAQFAHRVMGVPMYFEEPLQTAKLGIARLRSFFADFGLPQTFADLGADPGDIPRMVEALPFDEKGEIGAYMKLDRNACASIYYLAASSFWHKAV